MFHFSPIATAPRLSPQDNYLIALQRAKEAEAEYLRAQAVEQEEQAIYRRLEELRAQRERHSERPSVDRLSLLRQQLEEEERQQAARAYYGSRKLREEELLRQQFEQESAQRNYHHSGYRTVVGRHHEPSEVDAFHVLQELLGGHSQLSLPSRHSAVREVISPRPASFAFGNSRRHPHHRELHAQPTGSRHGEVDMMDILESLFGDKATQSSQAIPVASAQPVRNHEPEVVDLLQSLFGGQASSPVPAHVESPNFAKIIQQGLQHLAEAGAPKPVPESPSTQHPLAAVLQAFSGGAGNVASADSSAQSEKRAEHPLEALAKTFMSNVAGSDGATEGTESSSNDHMQALFKMFMNPNASSGDQAGPVASGSGTNKCAAARATHGDESQQVQDAILASLRDSTTAASTQPSARAPSAEEEEIAAAIKLSLQDSTPPAEPSPASPTSDKGKSKADNVSSQEPAAKTAEDGLDVVRSINAALTSLTDEFVFPAQLDFTPTSSPRSSPVHSDDESSSVTSRLPYTSRNSPVRYYEQALTNLLLQLDNVDSFGDERLRVERKEVVDKVEKAIEELESRVEGRRRLSEQSMRSVAKSTDASAVVSDALSSTTTPVPSVDTSVSTLQGYDVDDSPVHTEDAANQASPERKKSTKGGDDSDWSEVDTAST